MFSERKMGTPARLMATKSVKSDGTDKSQNLKNSRRANATIIKLMVDSCTHKFSFSTFVGRVKSDQPTIIATRPYASGYYRYQLQVAALGSFSSERDDFFNRCYLTRQHHKTIESESAS